MTHPFRYLPGVSHEQQALMWASMAAAFAAGGASPPEAAEDADRLFQEFVARLCAKRGDDLAGVPDARVTPDVPPPPPGVRRGASRDFTSAHERVLVTPPPGHCVLVPADFRELPHLCEGKPQYTCRPDSDACAPGVVFWTGQRWHAFGYRGSGFAAQDPHDLAAAFVRARACCDVSAPPTPADAAKLDGSWMFGPATD